MMDQLDECERLIRELKILEGQDKIIRVTRLCPKFAKWEVWYQTYRAAYSEAYFSQWSYNVGPCLYDYVLKNILIIAFYYWIMGRILPSRRATKRAEGVRIKIAIV